MHCYSCGSKIPDGLKFCVECGAPLDEAAASETPLVEEVPAAEEDAAISEPEIDNPTPTLPPDEAPSIQDTDEDDAQMDPTSSDFDPRKFAGSFIEAEDEPICGEETAPAGKPAKKKGKGGVIALVILLAAIVLAAAAGLLYWLTRPVAQPQLEQQFSQFMKMEAPEEITAFTIDQRETQRLKRSDDVWCSVTAEDGSVRTQRTYVMHYSLTRDGWQLRSVDDLSTENWITEPLVGASAEEVIAALTGREIPVNDDYTYTLTEEDAAAAEILDQTTDLAAGTDVVEVQVDVLTELVEWTMPITLDMAFAESWQMDNITMGEATIELKPGMEFELEEADFLADMAENPIIWGKREDDVTMVVNGEDAPEADTEAQEKAETQNITVEAEQVEELTVVETALNLKTNEMEVICQFNLVKPAAVLQVEATLYYSFRGRWQIDRVEYTPVVEKLTLTGTWEGTYTDADGKTPKGTLTFGTKEDGSEQITFSFAGTDTTVYATGSYYMTKKVDAAALTVEFTPAEWTAAGNPGYVTQVPLRGRLLLDESKLEGEGFSLQMVIAEEEAQPAA